MKIAITIVQLIISISLGALILLQAQGTGLGGAFGGGGDFYRSKRGMEKLLFRLTIIMAILFFVTSIANFLVQ